MSKGIQVLRSKNQVIENVCYHQVSVAVQKTRGERKRLAFFPAVERYNPQENRWHTIAPMGTRRKHLGCAVYQDMIYAVGGRDDTTELSSAERYNPRTNQWSPVVAMTSRRSGVSAQLLKTLKIQHRERAVQDSDMQHVTHQDSAEVQGRQNNPCDFVPGKILF